MMKEARPINILLVEDNEGDVFLVKKAFEKAKIMNVIYAASDGEMAMQMLKRQSGYSDFPKPDIILLDINMPKMDGRQVLADLKADPDLCRIPVIVLTSSEAEEDVKQSYDLQASGYIVKPINLLKFQEVVTAIEDFWFSIVVLPPK